MNATRRGFMVNGAATAAAMGFPTIISTKSFGANDRIALGCIGVGNMGTSNMRKFLEVPDCRVVAVCDVRRDRMERAKRLADKKYGDQGCTMLGDYQELLARKDIDGVMIAVQDHWHSLVATAAAKAGKDMYCEKPTGVCVNDGLVIGKAVKRYKRIFQSGMWQRSLGNFRQGAELALNGHLGRIGEIQVAVPAGAEYQPKYTGSLEPQPVPEGFVWDKWIGPAPYSPFNPGRVCSPDWYLLNDYCEGWTTNWGVHHLDTAHWGCPLIGEEPFEVECRGTYYINKGFANNIETWRANYTFASGLRMTFTDSGKQPIGTRFIGDKGWVHVDRNDKIEASSPELLRIRPSAGDRRLLPLDQREFDDVTTIKTKAGERVVYRKVDHWGGLIDSMRSRKEPVTGFRATHVASTLGMIAGIAARLQRKLKWDWRQERFIGDELANAMMVRPMHNGYHL